MTDQSERDILRVLRRACRQDRPEIAEFMLSALEKLDRERPVSPQEHRPFDAYREIAGISISPRWPRASLLIPIKLSTDQIVRSRRSRIRAAGIGSTVTAGDHQPCPCR